MDPAWALLDGQISIRSPPAAPTKPSSTQIEPEAILADSGLLRALLARGPEGRLQTLEQPRYQARVGGRDGRDAALPRIHQRWSPPFQPLDRRADMATSAKRTKPIAGARRAG
ncbi:hypothetical protein BE17_09955 [Sorangium cellulosum]|uniref:Uncharacterized protein n=1 Tax=Sorangium cellulosum TaxID=56 RepID=A0A150RD18_SORCE|nr:hypothetical protein BE17_09955 [Sorangium cellulosum]